MKKLDTDKYLHIPFSEADCYHLGSIMHKDYFGYELPSLDYQIDSVKSMLFAFRESRKDLFQVIDIKDIAYLDGIIFNSTTCGRHVGFYIGGGLFFHQNINGYPSVERLNSIKWKSKILGICRYEP